MPQVLIRDVDPALLERLKARAEANGRSLQAELSIILEQAGRTAAQARSAAARLRRKLAGRQHADSGDLQSADRGR